MEASHNNLDSIEVCNCCPGSLCLTASKPVSSHKKTFTSSFFTVAPETPPPPKKKTRSTRLTTPTEGSSPPPSLTADNSPSRPSTRFSSRRTGARFSARLQDKHVFTPTSPLEYKSRNQTVKIFDEPPEVTSMNYIYPCDLVPVATVPAPDTLADGLTHVSASRGGLELSIRRWRCCECTAVRRNLVRVSQEGSGIINPAAAEDTPIEEDNKSDQNHTRDHGQTFQPCHRCGAPPCDSCILATFAGEPVFTLGGRSIQAHWETPAWWRCASCAELTAFAPADTFALLGADVQREEGCGTVRCDSAGCAAPLQWDDWVYNDALVTLGTFDGRVVARNGPWASHVAYHEKFREKTGGKAPRRMLGGGRKGPGQSCVDRARKEIWYMPWKGFVRREKMEVDVSEEVQPVLPLVGMPIPPGGWTGGAGCLDEQMLDVFTSY